MVATAFEPVALDSVSDLDARVNPFIGYALEGFVVTPYLQWRTKSERVDVIAESPLQTDYCLTVFVVNPILTDFKVGRFHLHALAHFNHHQEHSDYLIVLNSRDDVEIGLFADNTLFGILDFYLCATFGA